TSPYSMLGTAVLQNAEILAGIVLTQLLRPGHPLVYCPSATVANMRTCEFTSGAPEGMLINIANIQMAVDFYKIPVRAMSGLTAAKKSDFQAGIEMMQNMMMGMLAGAHLLNESVGFLDNLLCVSYEKTILDGEIISRIKRINQGITGVDQDLCLESIQRVGHSGSYLNDPMTVKNCRNRWVPNVSLWGGQNDWEKEGSMNANQRANQKARQILADAPESLIDQNLDQALNDYITKESKKIGL
ncbi:MAG: trimethylamine--corrinoid methyltransferase, partial [Deltaproteobacteria bacterium]|nr:trimethylamine--corrinoid methyltransferase [Deltaproteobacteria bacterium]